MIILPKQFLNTSPEAVCKLSINLKALRCSDPGDQAYILEELSKVDKMIEAKQSSSINDRIRLVIRQAMYGESLQAIWNQARALQRHGCLEEAFDSFRFAASSAARLS